jgi:glutamate formiminotransferase/formiminotetrahydrofolate cyclodeaminase
MAKIVECIPNFSEGKRKEVVDAIANCVVETAGVKLLDVQMDADHNRCVITFAGEPQAAADAAFKMCKTASQLIDMNHQKGEHPRLGASDVIPFVPISDVTTEEAVELAIKLGERIWNELKIPVYLYEDAARIPARQDLSYIRQGEYEAIRDEMGIKPERDPDIGEPKMHPTAGAVVVGARFPLVAFNVNLGTKNVQIAKDIAKLIRFRSGGFKFCKALGFEIKERGYVQVSMNMTNYTKTSLRLVYEAIKTEAMRLGVLPIGAEIVGMVPLDAILDVSKSYLNLWEFKKSQILETRLGTSDESQVSWHPKPFIKEVASKSPAPGGGSVSASCGSLAAGLAAMVAKLSQSKRFAEVKEEMEQVAATGDKLVEDLMVLIQEDSDAFNEFLACKKLPSGTPETDEYKEKRMQEATLKAIMVPLKTMEISAQALDLIEAVAQKGNQNSLSDAGVASLCVRTAVCGAHLNVLINLPGLADRSKAAEISAKANEILVKATERAEKAYNDIKTKLSS